MNQKKIIFLVGPTAVGKTEVAVRLAERINGEIISCDSMQVYREISIASNKPSQDFLRKVPHHGIDVVSVEEEFDVAAFSRMALSAIAGIHRRGKTPIIAGGTGMYMQILLDGIFKGGKKDPQMRGALQERAHQEGVEILFKELQRKDPAAALKIHPHDTRRIIRALEVCLTTKQPISQLQKKRRGLWGKYDIAIFALNQNREILYKRIEARVEQMFEEGIVEEIESFEGKHLGRTAQAIIGIKEIRGYLEKQYDLARAKYLMKLNTRHLAKRQLTWFRKDKRLQWIMLDDKDSSERVVKRILSELAV